STLPCSGWSAWFLIGPRSPAGGSSQPSPYSALRPSALILTQVQANVLEDSSEIFPVVWAKAGAPAQATMTTPTVAIIALYASGRRAVFAAKNDIDRFLSSEAFPMQRKPNASSDC